jgi:dienelactone hydrolase
MNPDVLRMELLDRLGIPKTRVALAPEKRGERDLGDGTIVEKWLYTAEPGSHIPANLYRPASVKGRLPAIVMTCGHGDSKSLAHMQYVARTYARAGVACLLADPLGEEERHPQGRLGTREHDEQWVVEATQSAGRPVMGKLVFDAMRGLDFLTSLDCIDPDRIGVAGNSLGGAVAGWVWALEPRLRLAIVSGWAFGDYLCVNGKHCTNWPNQGMREVCAWPDYLRLGMANAPLLILNGDADIILDRDGSGTIWREMEANVQAADPAGACVTLDWCPGGGHRPYQGSKAALRFIHQQLGTPGMRLAEIEALPELQYGTWCDRHGVELEPLYGVDLHYRGARLPDFGFKPIPRDKRAVLDPGEIGRPEFTTAGWLKAQTIIRNL